MVIYTPGHSINRIPEINRSHRARSVPARPRRSWPRRLQRARFLMTAQPAAAWLSGVTAATTREVAGRCAAISHFELSPLPSSRIATGARAGSEVPFVKGSFQRSLPPPPEGRAEGSPLSFSRRFWGLDGAAAAGVDLRAALRDSLVSANGSFQP